MQTLTQEQIEAFETFEDDQSDKLDTRYERDYRLISRFAGITMAVAGGLDPTAGCLPSSCSGCSNGINPDEEGFPHGD